MFSGGIEIKILGNKFGGIPFESLKISLAKIRKLWVWIKTNLSQKKKHQKDKCLFHCKWYEIFQKPECSATQSSAMTHPYK